RIGRTASPGAEGKCRCNTAVACEYGRDGIQFSCDHFRFTAIGRDKLMLSPKTLFITVLIAALLALAGCDLTTGQEHVQRASEFRAQGKLDSAVIELKNALQKNPK